MKQIMKIVSLIVLCVVMAFAALHINQPNASTFEGRERILQEYSDDIMWKIHSETMIDGDIVCAIYSNQYDGLAWFHQNRDGKYNWQGTTWTAKGTPINKLIIKNTEVYEIYWLNRENVERFEVNFTFDDGTTETMQFDMSKRNIAWYQHPSSSFKFETIFYDTNGNEIEF